MAMPPMPNVNVNPTATSGADSYDRLTFGGSGGFNFGTYYGGGENSAVATPPWLKAAAVGGLVLLGVLYLRGKK